MEIKPFGNIDTTSLEDYYSAQMTINGSDIEIDLNFESESIDPSELEPVNDFIKKIDTIIKSAFEAVSNDFELDEESGTAKFYLQHHLDEFDENEITEIFGTTNIDKAAFMKSLKLTRIGLYPEDDEEYAIFDIQFPLEYTNYLMAVTFDSNNQLLQISMESYKSGKLEAGKARKRHKTHCFIYH